MQDVCLGKKLHTTISQQFWFKSIPQAKWVFFTKKEVSTGNSSKRFIVTISQCVLFFESASLWIVFAGLLVKTDRQEPWSVAVYYQEDCQWYQAWLVLTPCDKETRDISFAKKNHIL